MRYRKGWAPPSAQKVFLYYYWVTVALQYHVSFHCTTVYRLYIYTYIHISPPLGTSLPPFFPSRSPQSRKLSSYAIQQVPSSYIFYTWSMSIPISLFIPSSIPPWWPHVPSLLCGLSRADDTQKEPNTNGVKMR